MSDTIYLKRGQNLNLEIEFLDSDGGVMPLDETWAVSSALKSSTNCNDIILLTCVITEEGKVTVTQETDNLTSSQYMIDLIANDGNDREITEIFYLVLSSTITPLT
jgi:hypothetical protein